jgi:hypothetical protein
MSTIPRYFAGHYVLGSGQFIHDSLLHLQEGGRYLYLQKVIARLTLFTWPVEKPKVTILAADRENLEDLSSHAT